MLNESIHESNASSDVQLSIARQIDQNSFGKHGVTKSDIPSTAAFSQSGLALASGRVNYEDKRWQVKKCLREQREAGTSWRTDKKQLSRKTNKEMEYDDAEIKLQEAADNSQLVYGKAKPFFDALEK